MRTILTLKHWHIFGLLVLYEAMLAIFLNLTKIWTPWFLDAVLFNVIPIFGYPLLLTHAFDKYFHNSKGKSLRGIKTFDLFWSLWIISFFASAGFAKRERELEIENVSGSEKLIGIVLSISSLYFLFQFYKFLSKALKSIELRREAGIWEYVADTFQIFAWPLCIWWVQPRINYVFERLNRTKR